MKLVVPRTFFAPEVVQSSAMDCGPASLKCLLNGHHINASYGRLREACQTDVDGTSIDVMEEVALQLGLPAEQVMLPIDHLLLPAAKALPALIVVRLPNGNTHFVVLWRAIGGFVQVMDPAVGRVWMRRKAFLDSLYVHAQPVPANDWYEWASTDEFLTPLQSRIAALGIPKTEAKQLISQALASADWRSLAVLDAATRLVQTLVDSGGIQHWFSNGHPARQMLDHFAERALNSTDANSATKMTEIIPLAYWSVQPLPSPQEEAAVEEEADTEKEAAIGEHAVENDAEEDEDGPYLLLKGTVLIRILEQESAEGNIESSNAHHAAERAGGPLSVELQAALNEAPQRPLLDLIGMLRSDGLLTPLVLLFTVILAAGGVLVEALLLRGLLDLGEQFLTFRQRALILAAAIALVVLNLLVQLNLADMLLRYGRRLETQLRIAFYEKLPRLNDRYFQSRLMSDLAERSHSVYRLRMFPPLGGDLLTSVATLLLTAVGILWLSPQSWLIVLLAILAAIGIPLLAQPVL